MKKVLSLALAIYALSASATEVISHRANICNLVENSIEAIETSWASGIKAVEIDVRVSQDGIPYLYHDDEVAGTAIKALNYKEIVRLVGIKRAPTLRHVFEKGNPYGLYILDLKLPWNGNQDFLVQAVKESGLNESNIVIQSHDLSLLEHLKKRLPNCKYFYLSRLKRKFPFFRAPQAENLITEINDFEVDGVSIKGRKFISKIFVEKLQKSGVDVFVWTINDTDRFEHYKNIGVQGIITDRYFEFNHYSTKNRLPKSECN